MTRGLGPIRRYERDPAPVDLDALEPQRAWHPRTPRDLAADRERALTVACPAPRCRQPIGSPCVNLTTREPLDRAPAHVQRLTLAGVDLPPTTRAELSGWPTRRTEASRDALTRQTARRLRGW